MLWRMIVSPVTCNQYLTQQQAVFEMTFLLVKYAGTRYDMHLPRSLKWDFKTTFNCSWITLKEMSVISTVLNQKIGSGFGHEINFPGLTTSSRPIQPREDFCRSHLDEWQRQWCTRTSAAVAPIRTRNWDIQERQPHISLHHSSLSRCPN